MKSKKQGNVKSTQQTMWKVKNKTVWKKVHKGECEIQFSPWFPYKSAPHANIRGILFIQARTLMCIFSDLMHKNSIRIICQTKFGILGWTTQYLIFLFFLSQGLSVLVSVLIQLGDWSVIAKHWDSKMSFITLASAFCRFKDNSVLQGLRDKSPQWGIL